MLQHPGTGQGPVLRDVPDQEAGPASGLRQPHQFGGAVPHLRHRSRAARQSFGINRLYRVDHEYAGSRPPERVLNVLEPGGREDEHAVPGTPDPPRPVRHLPGRLLGGGVEHRLPGGRQEMRELEHQRALAYARLAPEQGHGTPEQPASEDPVQLGYPRGDPLSVAGRDVVDRDRLGLPARSAPGSAGTLLYRLLHDRVPGAAGFAPAAPGRAAVPALTAEEGRPAAWFQASPAPSPGTSPARSGRSCRSRPWGRSSACL